MRHPTANQVNYLLKVLWYLLPYMGELHHKSPWPPTLCSFMILYYLQCNIWMIRPSFCSPSGQVSSHCLWSTCWEIWLDVQVHTIDDCFCPFELHISEDTTLPYCDSPVWYDPQSEIPDSLRKKSLTVWPNMSVCGQEYGQEDWPITEN